MQEALLRSSSNERDDMEITTHDFWTVLHGMGFGALFVATGIAGAFGAFLNKYAPVRGGSSIILMRGE